MTTLHVVPQPADDDDAAAFEAAATVAALLDTIQAAADRLALAAEVLDDPDVADALAGTQLVYLADTLTAMAGNVAQLTGKTQTLGAAWCTRHGHNGRAVIGDEVWKAGTTGSSTSLKKGDKARVGEIMWRRLADHVTAKHDDETARVVRLALSTAAVELAKAADITPNRGAVAAGLDDEHPVAPGGVRWAINVSSFESPVEKGAGLRDTFQRASHQPNHEETATP